jgi:Ser/Thr protein kinase RdoA (MazF antagonist)
MEALKLMKDHQLLHGDLHFGNIVTHQIGETEIYKIIDLGGMTK